MNLTTDKGLIVYYELWREKYNFCGVRYFKQNVNSFWVRPILYTDSIKLAGEVVEKLNKKTHTK